MQICSSTVTIMVSIYTPSMFDLGIEPRSKALTIDSYRPRVDLPFWVRRRHWLLLIYNAH